MPDFQNFSQAVSCRGEPDRVPPLEYHVDNSVQAQFLGHPVETVDDQAEFFLKAGYDFVPLPFGMRRTLVERAARPEAAAQPGHMKVLQAHYSANRPEASTRLWAEEGAGLITDQASLESFDWPDPDGYNFHDVARLGQILPDQAKVIPLVGYVFAASWMLMGLERFCLDLAEGGGLAAGVVRKIGRIQLRVVENLLQHDCVGAVCMPDDLAHTTSLMVSPDFLRQEVFPWHKRIGDRVRAKGLPYLFHSDGRYLPVIDDLIECGYHAIHPCEPASMEMVDLKRQYGGRLCLCGNINLDSTLTLGTPADVEEEVKLRIRTVGPGGGYCCGSSNSVTEYVPFENYLAMIEATKKYGKYPL